MFHNFFKNIAVETQGLFSLTLGFILILGTLGKLQILQSLLNSIMILTGIILVIWGLNATKGINTLTNYFQTKK